MERHKMELGFVESWLPAVEQSVGYISRAVPYIYGAAGALAGRQVYKDYGKSRMLRKRTMAPRAGRRVRYKTSPTFAPSMKTSFRHTPYYFNLGLRPGHYPSKKHLETFSDSVLRDKRLRVEPLISVPYSDSERMNSRQGRLANVRGVKLRIWFQLKNQSEGAVKMNEPIMVRWAVLNPKTNDGTVDSIEENNFFISQDPQTEEAEDFPSTGNCFRYMNRKINRRKYGVLQQGKFIIQNDVDSNNTRVSMKSKKSVNLWLPVRRQMKWGNNIDDDPNSNLFFVCWYCDAGDKDDPQRHAADGVMDIVGEKVTYFKDSPGFN